MQYSWLLFDADGTLFDYEQAEAQALRDRLEQWLAAKGQSKDAAACQCS